MRTGVNKSSPPQKMVEDQEITKYDVKDFVSQGYRFPEMVFLLITHVLAVLGAVKLYQAEREVAWRAIALNVLLHYLCCIGIGSGVHRLWAHRSYTAKKPARIFMMLLNTLAFQGSIFHWSRDHRLHHKFSDTPIDPHSLDRGFFFSHMGWLLLQKNKALVIEGKKLDLSDLLEDPVVTFQKKYYWTLAVFIGFIIPTFVSAWLIGAGLWFGFVTAGVLRFIVMLNVTWCVNSVCHTYGTRPYNADILPTENWIVSILGNGEGWHNWHHEYPRDWRASENKWYKWNPNGYFIQFLQLIGQADISRIPYGIQSS